MTIVVTFFQTHQLIISGYTELLVQSDLGKALYGHRFFNISNVTMENCLQRCLENCVCLSFQICAGKEMTKCHLYSSNKYLKQSAIRKKKGCVIYSFGNPEKREVKLSSKAVDVVKLSMLDHT